MFFLCRVCGRARDGVALTHAGMTPTVATGFPERSPVHPNRATSTLFSNFLLFPAELARLIRADGHAELAAIVQPKPAAATTGERRSMTIPVGRMSDKIALPPQLFFAQGYRPGDPLRFQYDGRQVTIAAVSESLAAQIDNCEVDDDGIPIPPAWLIQAFTGGPDTIDHIDGGKRSAHYYVGLFNRLCGDFDDIERVLDFGCGCGRVLSRMPIGNGVKYFGVDLHPGGLEWLRGTMPAGTFSAGVEMPPLDFEDQKFDLVYSVSVLTHLNRQQERAWLDEWHRLLKVGGHVIATFRAEDWVEKNTVERQKRAIRAAWRESDGFCYQKHRYWDGIFPEFYAGTYQTIDYVRSQWGRRFEIVTIVPAAESPNEQNTAVMRKVSA